MGSNRNILIFILIKFGIVLIVLGIIILLYSHLTGNQTIVGYNVVNEISEK